jgi:ankyrin repeat domain-containing protein 50
LDWHVVGAITTVNALLSLENINVNLHGGAEDLTPLMEAARAGHVDIVRRLLERPRIDIEAKAAGKQTSLLLASKGGHDTIIELLLGATGTGASVTAVDSDGYTPLAHALAGEHEDIARRILDFWIEHCTLHRRTQRRRAGSIGMTMQI